MTLSHKQNAARSGLLARTVVPETDVMAEEWNELIDRIVDLEEGSVAGQVPTEDRVAVFDDFDVTPHGWFVTDQTAGGTLSGAGSANALGFPSSGLAFLSVSATASALIAVLKPSGLVFGADDDIVIEYAFGVYNSGTKTDDECAWALGVSSSDEQSSVSVRGIDGVHSLATVQGGVLTSEAITLPAYTGRLRVRLTISPTGTVVEAAADDGAYATVFTSAAAPDEAAYFPTMRMEKDVHAGNRTLVVDYMRASAARAAELPGAYVADSYPHVSPLARDGSVSLTGNLAVTASVTIDGRDISVDGTKLDGIEAGADVTDATNVMASIDWAETGDLAGVGTANAAGTSAEVPRADHVHAHGAQTDTTLHAEASYTAPGFMPAAMADTNASHRKIAHGLAEDFISCTTVLAGTRFLSSATGAGAGVSLLDNVAGHPGCVTMTTGTTTTGKDALYTGGGSIIRLGTDAIEFEAVFQVPVLSTVGEEYQLAAGWTDTVATAEPTAHGIMLVYDRLNRGNDKLYAVTAAAASGGPPLTTGITRTDTGITLVANDWVRVQIKINAARTSVEFWVGINGATPTLVATNTTDIPTATVLWAADVVILKSAGTTARTVIVDYIDPFYYRLTSAR